MFVFIQVYGKIVTASAIEKLRPNSLSLWGSSSESSNAKLMDDAGIHVFVAMMLSQKSRNCCCFCKSSVGWFSGSDVRTKSFFSPPLYGLLLVLLYMGPPYYAVWCGD